MDPRSWTLVLGRFVPERFVLGSSFLDLRSWCSRLLRGRYLLIMELVIGCEARCLRVFQEDGLYGKGGEGVWGLRLYFLCDARDRRSSRDSGRASCKTRNESEQVVK
jgi:hypothetical protein